MPDAAVALLHERTEGWAVGLRLAALSLAGHPDPVRFAAEFGGSERTIAEYLLAEVLDRQSDRINGELGDPLEWALKDVDLAIDAGRGTSLPMLAALSRQWHSAVEAGHGRNDISAARLALT
jgi:3-hydroxyisobutyrate dehydrogenase-like beta-hydroxyacid dehydrogenase